MANAEPPCSGHGECLRQCICECGVCTECGLSVSDCQCAHECEECEECEDDCSHPRWVSWENCTCGHRAHYGNCPPNVQCPHGCEPKLCHNDANHEDDERGTLYPEWLFGCHDGSCVNCAISYGHGFKHTDKVAECPVCYDQKRMTRLRCAHELCWECWSAISQDRTDASCPLCRRSKW